MEFNQASDVYINVTGRINGRLLTAVQKAVYIVFDRNKTILLQKELGSGVLFNSDTGVFTVRLKSEDTENLGPGRFSHELVVQDPEENDTFLLKGNFKIIETVART